jgi:hypothetical protein
MQNSIFYAFVCILHENTPTCYRSFNVFGEFFVVILNATGATKLAESIRSLTIAISGNFRRYLNDVNSSFTNLIPDG